MELRKTEHLSRMEAYQQRIFYRDQLKKEAFSFQEEYYRIFGDLMLEAFQLKIECIRLKKEISYCQFCINQNRDINQNELNTMIEKIMEDYQKELKQLSMHVNLSKEAKTISPKDLMEIKKIYRRIVKKIHPDLNPESFKKREVKDLWDRMMLAYQCNQLEELKEIEVLLEFITKDASNHSIENLEERLEKLNEEIERIVNTNPYQYKFLLNDENEVKEQKDNYLREIKEYQKYKNDLEELLKQFEIKEIFN